MKVDIIEVLDEHIWRFREHFRMTPTDFAFFNQSDYYLFIRQMEEKYFTRFDENDKYYGCKIYYLNSESFVPNVYNFGEKRVDDIQCPSKYLCGINKDGLFWGLEDISDYQMLKTAILIKNSEAGRKYEKPFYSIDRQYLGSEYVIDSMDYFDVILGKKSLLSKPR